MHVFSAWTLESFASRVVANNAACVAGGCLPVGPGLLPARKNHSLASRTSGGLSGDILKTMPFEPNATPVFQIKRKKKGEERWSAASRAHVTHSRVAHAADLSLYL
ncbi:hypothetical protein Hanom_Chr05g00405761 [Helianthus anomalus]